MDSLYPCLLFLKPGGCWRLGVTTAGSPQVSVASLEFLSRFSRAWGSFSLRSGLRSGEMAVISRLDRSHGVRKAIYLAAGAYLQTCKESFDFQWLPRHSSVNLTLSMAASEHPAASGPRRLPCLTLCFPPPLLVGAAFEGLLVLQPIRSAPSRLQPFPGPESLSALTFRGQSICLRSQLQCLP